MIPEKETAALLTEDSRSGKAKVVRAIHTKESLRSSR